MNDYVSISLQDKHYDIKCKPSEINNLKAAANYLNQALTQTRQQYPTSSPENRIALAALNITHDLLIQKKHNEQQVRLTNERVRQLQDKIENVLSPQEELAV